MRLQGYLSEDAISDKAAEKKKAEFKELTNGEYEWEDITTKLCKPWFDAVKSYPDLVWRGMAKMPTTYGFKAPRTDRKPKDTYRVAHTYIDDLFYKKFGWHCRSEGMFCSADEKNVDQYGKVYIVFPVGAFKYVWGKNIKDLYDHTKIEGEKSLEAFVAAEVKRKGIKDSVERDSIYMNTIRAYGESQRSGSVNAALAKYYDFLINEFGGYTDTNLIGAMQNEHELMIKCDKYMYFDNREFYMCISKLMAFS